MKRFIDFVFSKIIKSWLCTAMLQQDEVKCERYYMIIFLYTVALIVVFFGGILFVLGYSGLRYNHLIVNLMLTCYAMSTGSQFYTMAKGKNFVEEKYEELKNLHMTQKELSRYRMLLFLKFIWPILTYVLLLAVICYLIRPYTLHLETFL